MKLEPVEQAISQATGETFKVEKSHAIGGGCINDAVCLEGGGQRFFVKLNSEELLPMFEAEAAGLAEILATKTLRAPSPVTHGTTPDHSFLVLEYIELHAASAGTSDKLGEQLAAMHHASAEAFGWERDNTIGATAQINSWDTSWVSFYGEHRLGHQLALAAENGAPTSLIDDGRRLLESLPDLFNDYQPSPSLLHGDLWGGNWGTDEHGQPVIFDPAVYFGDREADLAMTELFGGFDDRFYHSYRHAWTFAPGYETRKVLYNLYHILNHYNLFGGGYARQAQGMIDRLIAEVS